MMKKGFGLVVALLLGFTMTAQAQLLKVGIKGGLNTTKMSFSNVGNSFKSSNRLGVFIGPMAELNLPVVGLGVDGAFMLAYKDSKVKQYGADKHIKDKTVTEIGIDIPLNLKYTFGFSRLVAVYVAAGPDFFFNLGKSPRFKDVKFNKKNAQMAVNIGGGVKFLKHYQAGLTYNIPVTKSAEFVTDSGYKQSYKSRTWQMSFAYLF